MCMTVNLNAKTNPIAWDTQHDQIEDSFNDENTDKISDEKVYIADFLAITTFYTRNTFSVISASSERIKKSTLYK